jgi:phosphoglycolate phosphatase-like HAD superfamily hydrolase
MQFSTRNEAAFIIGDSVSDIRAAKEASIQSVAVGWGHQSLDRLIAMKPDYVVHAPKELLEIFEKVG